MKLIQEKRYEINAASVKVFTTSQCGFQGDTGAVLAIESKQTRYEDKDTIIVVIHPTICPLTA